MFRLLDRMLHRLVFRPVRCPYPWRVIGQPEYWQYRNRLRTDIALRYNPKRDRDESRSCRLPRTLR